MKLSANGVIRPAYSDMRVSVWVSLEDVKTEVLSLVMLRERADQKCEADLLMNPGLGFPSSLSICI